MSIKSFIIRGHCHKQTHTHARIGESGQNPTKKSSAHRLFLRTLKMMRWWFGIILPHTDGARTLGEAKMDLGDQSRHCCWCCCCCKRNRKWFTVVFLRATLFFWSLLFLGAEPLYLVSVNWSYISVDDQWLHSVGGVWFYMMRFWPNSGRVFLLCMRCPIFENKIRS